MSIMLLVYTERSKFLYIVYLHNILSQSLIMYVMMHNNLTLLPSNVTQVVAKMVSRVKVNGRGGGGCKITLQVCSLQCVPYQNMSYIYEAA